MSKPRHRLSAVADLEERLDLLPDVGEPLLAEMGQEAALTSVLHHARELTGARYAAVGVLDQDRLGLQRFLTLGVDDATRRGIGELPHGRGILGVLIDGPSPLLIADIRTHPDYYGFPPGHPEMRSFLGVPIVINERAWGNLYLGQTSFASSCLIDEIVARGRSDVRVSQSRELELVLQHCDDAHGSGPFRYRD